MGWWAPWRARMELHDAMGLAKGEAAAAPRHRAGARADPCRQAWWAQWGMLVLVLMSAAGLAWYAVASERGLALEAESDRLSAQARAVDMELQRQLRATRQAMEQLRRAWTAGDRTWSSALVRALRPMVMGQGPDALMVVDRRGGVVLSDSAHARAPLWDGALLAALTRMSDPDMVRVFSAAAPLQSAPGLWLVMPVAEDSGPPAHFVVAALNPDYFQGLPRSVTAVSGAAGALMLDTGAVLALSASGRVQASKLETMLQAWQGGDAIRRMAHREPSMPSLPETPLQVQGDDGDASLVVRHAVDARPIGVANGFVVVLARDIGALSPSWRRLGWMHALTLLSAALAGGFALRRAQRGRRAWCRRQQQCDAARADHAQRMALALAGTGAGLWELHVPDDCLVLDARAAAMQGTRTEAGADADMDADAAVQPGAVWRGDIHPDDRPQVEASLAGHLRGEAAAFDAEFRVRHREGHWIWIHCHGEAVERDAQGHARRVLGTRMDVTERRQQVAEIQRLTYHDGLTGLPNRRLLQARLVDALETGRREGQRGAVVFLNLDHFKDLNGTLGHPLGDALLVRVAHRLRQVTRDSDTVARVGGDEFVVLLEGLGTQHADARRHAESFGNAMLHRLSRPYHLLGRQIHNTPSIGIALFDGTCGDADQLLIQADLALCQARTEGRNTVGVFEPALQATIAANAQLQADLHQALHRGELMLYYQPIHDRQRCIVGVEALVRWRHPREGMVPPSRFIPVAEQCGLVLPLGDWVLEQACRQLHAWAARPATAHLTVAVNISARQLRQADFVAKVIETVQRSGAEPQRLKLELTESMFLFDAEDVITKIAALKQYGIGFALDDFGTGYSSLSYLQRLPLDQLKIDQSFVRELPANANGATIACAIIGLAHSLGLKVIAEGVETEAQMDFLLQNHCDAFQGYRLSTPGPVGDVERRLPTPPAMGERPGPAHHDPLGLPPP